MGMEESDDICEMFMAMSMGGMWCLWPILKFEIKLSLVP